MLRLFMNMGILETEYANDEYLNSNKRTDFIRYFLLPENKPPLESLSLLVKYANQNIALQGNWFLYLVGKVGTVLILLIPEKP